MASYGNPYGSRPFSMFPPVIKWLLGINVVIFIIGLLPAGIQDGFQLAVDDYFTSYGALWPLNHPAFGAWQYFTYMFLHGGVMHLFFNMLILWMFGMELEQAWGSRRFLLYYLLCGLGAGVLHSLVTLAMGTGAPTVGASGAIMGVMIAFGMMFPDRIIMVYFFFPMRAKYAVFMFAGLDLVLGITNSSDGIAHFAHLGGALIGLLLLKTSGIYLRGGLFQLADRGRPASSAPFRTPTERTAPTPSRGNVIEANFREAPPRQNPNSSPSQDQQGIDAILDKISRHGYQNLTPEEKAALLEASKRMQRG
ncbi:MAG: rhomboid family intramembrane serine protease [Chlorobi bacterium CHB2]|nr:rhomboid family intramembrane serine protease [Chlorobi bacterium CHB2]